VNHQWNRTVESFVVSLVCFLILLSTRYQPARTTEFGQNRRKEDRVTSSSTCRHAEAERLEYDCLHAIAFAHSIIAAAIDYCYRLFALKRVN
jgi:hypothetical protein